MQYIRNPISTLCCGQAASMASLLLAAGEKGHRQSLPNSRIMMHQPSGGYQVHQLALSLKLQRLPSVVLHLALQIYTRQSLRTVRGSRRELPGGIARELVW